MSIQGELDASAAYACTTHEDINVTLFLCGCGIKFIS
jgi:hypothetical protein